MKDTQELLERTRTLQGDLEKNIQDYVFLIRDSLEEVRERIVREGRGNLRVSGYLVGRKSVLRERDAPWEFQYVSSQGQWCLTVEPLFPDYYRHRFHQIESLKAVMRFVDLLQEGWLEQLYDKDIEQ